MTTQEKIDRLEKRLELYYQAEESVLLRQSYKIGSREVTFADLPTIKAQIKTLETELERLTKSKGKRKVRRIIPLDI